MKTHYPHFTDGKEKQKETEWLAEHHIKILIEQRYKPGLSDPKLKPKLSHFPFSAYYN